MKKHIALFSLVTAAFIAAPVALRADDTVPPATTETAPAKKKNADATPYHGKVVAVNATASTITVGENKLTVTAETKISKDGKKSKLADIAVGDKVRGAYKKDANGNLNAVSLREGEKAGNGTKKKKAAKE